MKKEKLNKLLKDEMNLFCKRLLIGYLIIAITIILRNMILINILEDYSDALKDQLIYFLEISYMMLVFIPVIQMLIVSLVCKCRDKLSSKMKIIIAALALSIIIGMCLTVSAFYLIIGLITYSIAFIIYMVVKLFVKQINKTESELLLFLKQILGIALLVLVYLVAIINIVASISYVINI